MLPIVFLVIVMASSAILGGEKWQGGTTKYVVMGVLAFLQTAFVLLYMFTMKMPHP